MTQEDKRFHAACAAMQGILANEQLVSTAVNTGEVYGLGTDVSVVRMSYEFADELLNQG